MVSASVVAAMPSGRATMPNTARRHTLRDAIVVSMTWAIESDAKQSAHAYVWCLLMTAPSLWRSHAKVALLARRSGDVVAGAQPNTQLLHGHSARDPGLSRRLHRRATSPEYLFLFLFVLWR